MIHLVYKVRIRRQESQKSDSYWQEFEYDGSKNSSVATVLKELNSRTPLKDNSGNIVTPSAGNVAVWCENVGLAPC